MRPKVCRKDKRKPEGKDVACENNDHCGSLAKGVVIARECERCGHHEIGIETESGEYIPLKKGMVVEILEDQEQDSAKW